jgi:phosphopantetheinyl transferase
VTAGGGRQLVEFNVSHAGAWTVIAAEQIQPGGGALDLGVDLMPTTDRWEVSFRE